MDQSDPKKTEISYTFFRENISYMESNFLSCGPKIYAIIVSYTWIQHLFSNMSILVTAVPQNGN